MMYGQYGEGRLEPATCTQQMPVHRLGRTDLQVIEGVAPDPAESIAFDHVTGQGGRAMGIAVADVGSCNATIAQRCSQCTDLPSGVRFGQMGGVA